VHYIPVKEDLSDAWDLMAFAREHDDLMKKIADNGKKFIKDHLKQDDIYDYWYNLLTEYAKLVTWDVKKDPSAVLVKHP
jgi:protein glucosyltransferase